tara:strand:+ start:29 stop:538 length:510 start_codon:yes stop_codon:yes gene_type:complete
MPKATASWLIENTSLSFKQISEFVGMHILEIQAIADGEVSGGILPRNPLENGELTQNEINRCEKDDKLNLNIKDSEIPIPNAKTKGSKYTPLSKRAEKPNGIYWFIKNIPEIPDSQICKLIGTTKKTVQSLRDRSFWNMQNVRAQNPFELGLCNKEDIEKVIDKYKNKT